MYGIPKELDLSPVLGEFTTQVRVGQFDLQFTFGSVSFAVQSSGVTQNAIRKDAPVVAVVERRITTTVQR